MGELNDGLSLGANLYVSQKSWGVERLTSMLAQSCKHGTGVRGCKHGTEDRVCQYGTEATQPTGSLCPGMNQFCLQLGDRGHPGEDGTGGIKHGHQQQGSCPFTQSHLPIEKRIEL
ncbi:hypothetical protein Spb1_17480 [Planctopirus ephydatiae]|uniref:Uncharacterized protein n=1 Tax=Planctopirus ephydatiae TaxID=2528019 RepID=A0A518GMI3_9PLAN|nr:hypothetical protein Spb1_17480 [Planctopirus ephydatiae]